MVEGVPLKIDAEWTERMRHEKECRFCYDLYMDHTRALYGSWTQNLSHHSSQAF